MITEIQLKFGHAPVAAAPIIPVTPVTIFVGPNNSGKSKVLAEIQRMSTEGHNHGNVILEKLSFEALSEDNAKAVIAILQSPLREGEVPQPGHIILESAVGGRVWTHSDTLFSVIQRPASRPDWFGNSFLRHLVLRLDGPNRVQLVNESSAGDLQRRPHSSLQALFADDQKRKEVRRIVHEAFGSYFVIDPTHLGTLRIRLSPRAPIDDMEERNIHAAGVAFHSQAEQIETTSDSVKAFTGIVAELAAGDHRILLIDEPEAFLHPSLATKLGYEIAKTAVRANKRIFASTHSPQFIMGCIQSGVPINIIRLTYRFGVPTARLLPSNEILELMRNPLLRSTGVLNGLFYEHVVVTESDADRAFYQEINEQILA